MTVALTYNAVCMPIRNKDLRELATSLHSRATAALMTPLVSFPKALTRATFP